MNKYILKNGQIETQNHCLIYYILALVDFNLNYFYCGAVEITSLAFYLGFSTKLHKCDEVRD